MNIGESTSAARQRAQTWPPAPRSNTPSYPGLTYDQLMDRAEAENKSDKKDDKSPPR